jgi:exodeoxyribonuclease I
VLADRRNAQVCIERGIPEHEFARKILELLGRTGTIGVGYNTIKFDDEITRFLLWRCLQDPYGREWQNNCGRWDIINMVRAAYALRPDGINWLMENDRAVFNLSKLTEANGLKHETAHDALSDVLATIGLAKLVKQVHPALFDFCLTLRQKREVEAQVRLGTYDPVIYISTLNGGKHGGSWWSCRWRT